MHKVIQMMQLVCNTGNGIMECFRSMHYIMIYLKISTIHRQLCYALHHFDCAKISIFRNLLMDEYSLNNALL